MSVSTPSIQDLFEPGKLSIEDAEQLALEMMDAGQRIPERIALALQAEPLPDGFRADRMIELLGRITPPARLLPLLDRVMPSSNSRIRSKAWKLYATASLDLSWAKQHIDDEDPRVAANVIEALWRAEPTAELHDIFRVAALQERNRVAGNGLVGLFSFEDPLAVEIVNRMAAHTDPSFRATAAWVIGRVYWREGTEILKALKKDVCEKVRINADRSILRIAQRYPGFK